MFKSTAGGQAGPTGPRAAVLVDRGSHTDSGIVPTLGRPYRETIVSVILRNMGCVLSRLAQVCF